MALLRKKMIEANLKIPIPGKSKFVDCQTVDTFQGEENDIVILSLTRNKRQTRFLELQNRLCVSGTFST